MSHIFTILFCLTLVTPIPLAKYLKIESIREEAKRPYQKILLTVACAVIGLVVSVLISLII